MRMLLFGSFLTTAAAAEQALAFAVREGIQKCLGSAKQTIEIIYETYRHHDYFRTWQARTPQLNWPKIITNTIIRFYNTTYTLFAVSIILIYIMQEASASEKQSLFESVEMSIEILETMNECVVAQKAAKMIRRALTRAKESSASFDHESNDRAREPFGLDAPPLLNHYWGPLNMMDGGINISFPFEMGDLAEFQSSLGDFGTSANLYPPMEAT